MKTFKEWLQEKANDNTNIGDLARDSISDGDFPDSYKKDVYERYLLKMGADELVMVAFNAAFNTYITEFEKNRKNTQVTSITLSDGIDEAIQSFVQDYRFNNTSSAVEFLIRKGLSE